MINNIPNSWKYNDSLEMLFLFYQCSEELMSNATNDTYALPQHNTITLAVEIDTTYSILESNNSLKDYYDKYIPPILDELIFSIQNDEIIKSKLGRRLESFYTGFREAKTKSAVLTRWVDALIQACSVKEYMRLYRNELHRLVTKTNDKDQLIKAIKNYYVSIIHAGYSREFVFTSIRKFFDNQDNEITSNDQIITFTNIFSCRETTHEFIILMDTFDIDYLDSIDKDLSFGSKIQKIDVTDKDKLPTDDHAINELYKVYSNKLAHQNKNEQISIVRLTISDYDRFSAIQSFEQYISFLQSISIYFKHHHYHRQIYQILYKKEDGRYSEVKQPSLLMKRPFIEQTLIDTRVRNIFRRHSLGNDTFYSLLHALRMHADAIDSNNMSMVLRNLWTSMESIFADYSNSNSRDDVVVSCIAILQKTYILKILRCQFAQLKNATTNEQLLSLGINNFSEYVEYFSTYSANSEEMKKIYALLTNNPLLRSRIFHTREALKDGEHIKSYLESHRQKIEWQLKRIQRYRNIATHLGQEMDGQEIVVNHIHNYFDFIVNYIVCKAENNNYVVSVSSTVFEAKNDNSILMEYLKDNQPLSKDNYLDYLFGPDKNLVNYNFEF